MQIEQLTFFRLVFFIRATTRRTTKGDISNYANVLTIRMDANKTIL
jgi:hypothetical protein